MRLVIAEKPSVARDIARVIGARARGKGCIEGPDLIITWCIGHLVELDEPVSYRADWKRWAWETLPMIPETFQLRPRRDSGADQWAIVKRLLTDRRVTEVVNACDAGREGELIFRYAYDLAGCKAPILRFWTSSMTDVAIKSAWSNLQPGARFEALGDAARCRSEADWLVGLNATRAMTVLARQGGTDSETLSVGRVQTPTLALIVQRDQAIEAFVSVDYWQVKAQFLAEPGGWEASWFRPREKQRAERRPDGEAAMAERLDTESEAEALVQLVQGRPALLEVAERKRLVEPPPLLYDLTSLQRRANQRYGFSAEDTLNLAQALYERHKVLTYPRTDARYLTPDQVPGLVEPLRALQPLAPYQVAAESILERPLKPGRRVVNAAEVGDHHAIIPTGRSVRGLNLSVQEKQLYDLVARRFLAALSEDALFDQTRLVAKVLVEGEPRFRARGRICQRIGWRAIDPPKKSKDLELPNVQVGDPCEVKSVKSAKGQTRPPKPHRDASLLRAMETAGKDLDDRELKRALRSGGLGTPATRAAILQTLIRRRYITRKNRDLRATDRGRALIQVLPVAELKSAELTGRWESRLAQIAEGQADRAGFMADVVSDLTKVIEQIKQATPPAATLVSRPQGPSLGTCPACQKPVRERGPVYSCDAGRSCVFVVFKSMAKRSISTTMVKALLKSGKTRIYKGFKSKKGADFEAGLCVDESGKVQMYFPPREASRYQPERTRCPKCGRGDVIRGRSAWGCSAWREGCDYRTDTAP